MPGTLYPKSIGTRAGTIKGFTLEDCFETAVLSGEIKAAKPGPQVFTAVLDALAVCPRSTIFVDNSPANIDGVMASACRKYFAPLRRRRWLP